MTQKETPSESEETVVARKKSGGPRFVNNIGFPGLLPALVGHRRFRQHHQLGAQRW